MAITKPPPKAGAAAASSPATAGAGPVSSDTPAQLAKAALRRLALDKLEPTPDNYARAYQLEQGGPPPASLPERAQRTLERLVARGFEVMRPLAS
jgi:diguanylate cyclase